MNITKILLSIIIGVVICGTITPTNATTMCITDDNTSIILDPSKNGTKYTRDEVTKTWATTFSYGTLSGEARCTGTSGENEHAYPQYNFDNYPIGTTAANSSYMSCWCKITYPVRSAWGLSHTLDTGAHCANICANDCGAFMQSYPNFRRALFNTVGM
jgi:hypothetical protein